MLPPLNPAILIVIAQMSMNTQVLSLWRSREVERRGKWRPSYVRFMVAPRPDMFRSSKALAYPDYLMNLDVERSPQHYVHDLSHSVAEKLSIDIQPQGNGMDSAPPTTSIPEI